MPLWKRIAFWIFTALLLTLVVGVILLFSIDRSIKIYPGIASDVLVKCRTIQDVKAFLGGPPGDYTTMPYSFDAPDARENAEQRRLRNEFMNNFDRRWISNDGCVMVAIDASGSIVRTGQVPIYLSREPGLLDILKKRLRLSYVSE